VCRCRHFSPLILRPGIDIDQMLAVQFVFLGNFTFDKLDIAVDIEPAVLANKVTSGNRRRPFQLVIH